jgi:hypothetical protein
MRILVTGSRDWPYPGVVDAELRAATLPTTDSIPITIIQGGCPTGADEQARQWVDLNNHGWTFGRTVIETHPADWKTYGKGAGPIRNQEMVALGADLCLVFRFNESKGATDCMMRAYAAGIRVRLIDLRITG